MVNSLSKEQQSSYIDAHPKSKYAKMQKSADKEDNTKTSNKPIDKSVTRQINKIKRGFRDPNETGADRPYIVFNHDNGYEVRLIPQIDYDKPVKSWDDLEIEPMFVDENGDDAYPDNDYVDIPDEAKKKFVEFYNKILNKEKEETKSLNNSNISKEQKELFKKN